MVESIDAVQAGRGDGDRPGERHQRRRGQTGGVVARLNLKLDKDAEPLPKDSIFRVRYRSAFGLKYLEIVRGEGEPAPEGFVFDGLDDQTDRATACDLPGDERFASAQSVAERLLPAADRVRRHQQHLRHATRTNARTNLVGFGNAFAGRGTSLNDAINSLEPLFTGLRPVTRVLLEPDTQLRRFFPELGDAARILAPVAEQQADVFTTGRDRLRRDLVRSGGARRRRSPRARRRCETGIDLLPRQRPFLRDFATLSEELRPGVKDLRATLPVLNDAIEVGTPVLRRLHGHQPAPGGRPALARPRSSPSRPPG